MFDTLIFCGAVMQLAHVGSDTLVIANDSLLFLNREALVVSHTRRRESGKTYYFTARSFSRESGRWYRENGAVTVLPEALVWRWEDRPRPIGRCMIVKRKPRRK